MSTLLGSARSAASSFGIPLQGLRLLWTERSLWPLAVVPVVLSLVAVVLALGGVIAYAGEIHASATAWLPALRAEAWFEWLWIGPARALLWLLGTLLFATAVVVAVVVALLLASVLAAPFHDALSRRVEVLVTGRVQERETSGAWATLREGARAVREELRHVLFFAVVWLGLAALGFLVPGGQLLAAPLLTLATLLFLPLDYAGYTLDRRGLSFRERRAWLLRHADTMLGFGAGAFLVCAVPGLNLLAMPVLVVAGTLLALRHPVEPGS